ncbi:uncharacterized protein LOC141700941 [Apium graveolens]|uniref:uncharacterized protein LOC141700941 n=1 Tax=Apium graveolens TaxID=4045 RepID=UPI003D7BEE12
MGRHVFLRIVDALSCFDPYFQQMVDALGRKGLSPLQKCIVVIRMSAYGVSADAVDDYIRIGESTIIECLKKFVTDVKLVFENEYLRKPNLNDVRRLLEMGEARGFPGMMGSIDFAKSNNDINILDRSHYSMKCLKVVPLSEKRKLFSKYQEGQRKDIARAFGVLQSRFAIIRGPARFWDKGDLARIMRVCIILQNMIVEDERDTYATIFGPLPSYDDTTNGISQPNIGEESFVPHENYIQRIIQIRDR